MASFPGFSSVPLIFCLFGSIPLCFASSHECSLWLCTAFARKAQGLALQQPHGAIRGYRKRFSHEHGYRFLKQDLLWEQAHLRTPEQVECWSWIVACACNLLLVSRSLGMAALHPWESKQRQATPRQVRRVMPSILQQLGTPAQPPKPRGKSPGWRKGRQRRLAPRFAVVKKPKPVPKSHRKRA